MKRGFTLIELLVVVAIIAILAAMLLPALNRAREQAKAAACQQNMKNMATAMQMYMSDYGGYTTWFPKSSLGNTPYGQCCFDVYWYEVWTPYTDGIEVFNDPVLNPRRIGNSSNAAGKGQGHTVGGYTFTRRDDFIADYIWNYYSQDAGAYARRTIDEILFPSTTLGLMDHQSSGWSSVIQYGPGALPVAPTTSQDGGINAPYSYRSPRYHLGGANFMYMDGHVKYFAADFLGRDWYEASSARQWLRTRWDIDRPGRK